MVGLWDASGIPHRGWECVGMEDLGEPSGNCAMCGKTDIRYVHTMRHPDYPDELDVGCICAGNMETDYEAPRERERELRNTANRREHWLARRWRVSEKGNEFIKANNHVVVVFPTRGGYQLRIDQQFGRLVYPDKNSAKLKAFDYLNRRTA